MHLTIHTILAQAEGAAATPPPGGGIGGMMMMLIPMVVIWYILLIKPQRKKQQQHEELNKSLMVGDKIITLGGIHAEVVAVDDSILTVKIADKVKIQINRSSIAEKVKTESPDATDGKAA